MFTITFQTRQFARMVQPNVKIGVKSLSWSVMGGCDRAVLTAKGDRLTRQSLEQLLRCPICITNELGQAVWWGYLNSVSTPRGDFDLNWDLDRFANKVAMRYATPAPWGQAGEVQQTDWAQNAESQALYGVKECILSLHGVDALYAERLRDVTLAQNAFPGLSVDKRCNQAREEISLTCQGWVHILTWTHYQTSAGLIANTPTQKGTQFLGNTYSDLWLAESVTPQSNMVVSYVDVRLRKVGSPSDDARVQIQSDTNGIPSGNVLGTALVSASSISADGYPWQRFTFSTPVALCAGTPYWLVLGRAGQPSQTDYYMLGVDETMGFEDGVFKIYNHVITSWIPRSPECDLLFRVIALQETTGQMVDVFEVGKQFLSMVRVAVESGIEIMPFQQGVITCYQALADLLRLGTSEGLGLLAEVSRERCLEIRTQPEKSVADWWIDAAGVITDAYHNRLMPGESPVGRWVRVKGSEGVVYVERAVMDGQSGKIHFLA